MAAEASIRPIVFIGAGASNFAGIPTVHSFFERVAWPPSDGLSAACQELARRISIFEGNEDCLGWPKYDAEKLFGWLELLERIGDIHDSRMGIHIPNPPIPIPVDGVIAHLRSEIVRIYGNPITKDFLANTPHVSLIELLDRLSPPADSLHVFTTNYDPVLEQVCGEWDGGTLASGRKLRACTGFSAGRPGHWQPELFEVPAAADERLIQLVKLHGSATWKMGDSGPVETGWARPTEHDCLLYFGYKSVPEREPFIALHGLLKMALLQYDAVIAIGFRFADPYIRELFDFALRANQRLRVICVLTRSPDSDSPLGVLMNHFGDRVFLLADRDGKAIPFGHPDFAETLERILKSTRQAETSA